MNKQVDKDHYGFSKYVSKQRWASMWHQLDEVLSLFPKSVLEVGPGPGLFKPMVSSFGVEVKTLDIAEDLNPDFLCHATDMPFEDNQFELVCSFQMLEHLPYEESLKVFTEMTRVAGKYIVISIPDAKTAYPCSIYVPKVGTKYFQIPKPFAKPKDHIFNGEHYWEINKEGYDLLKVRNDFLQIASDFKLVKTYRVPENPYHRFFVYMIR